MSEENDGEIDDIEAITLNIKMNINNIGSVMESIFIKYNKNIEVFLVDEQYQCKYYYTENGKSEYEFLKTLKQNESIKFINSNWDEYLPHFGGLDDEETYFFISSIPFLNEYEMANFLGIPLNRNCYFKWGAINIEEIQEVKSYYNIFSNVRRSLQIDSFGNPVTINEESLKWIVENGVRQVQGLILCGCLKKERFIQSKVESWILNPYSIFSKGVIIETGLIPKPHPDVLDSKILKGLTILEQFNEDASYRYRLTTFMCRILCKYGLEFKKIKTIGGDPHLVNFDFLL